MSARSAFLLFFSMLAGLAHAQSLHDYAGLKLTEVWTPQTSTVAPFGRACAGEFSGDGCSDAVLLDGDRAVVLVDPDFAHAPLELPVAVLDTCILAAHLGDGCGVIATTASTGLSAWSYAPTTPAMTEHPLRAGAWLGARILRAADLDGSGRADLIGVGADSRAVLVELADASAYSFQSGSGFTAVDDVIDVVALQWDYDTPLELALLSPSGVNVHDLDGTLLATHAAVLPGGTIARVAQQGVARDRLAWITAWAPPAQQWLITLSSLGAESLLDVGALDVVACVGADFDADGDDDLLISHKYSYDLVWLENMRSAAAPAALSFLGTSDGTGLFRVGPHGENAHENRAWPALADFDRDGDIDVVFGCERTLKAVYVRGNWIDESTARPVLSAASYNAGVLELTLAQPATLPVAATHLEVDAWLRESITSTPTPLGIAHARIALPATWPAVASLTLDGTAVEFSAHYLRIRAVQVAASGAVLNEYPCFVGVMSSTTSWTATLLDEGAFGAPLEVAEETPPESNPEPGIHATTRSRRFTEGTPPIPAPITPGGS